MPLADLPYRIERLTKNGQYAHLTYTSARAKKNKQQAGGGGEIPHTADESASSKKLRVMRNVTLCDGPELWETVVNGSPEPYYFFVDLRLFGTLNMVNQYLSGPEVASFCQTTRSVMPTAVSIESTRVVSEQTFNDVSVAELAEKEYMAMLQSRQADDYLSMQGLEELLSKSAVGTVAPDGKKKRGRKPKNHSPLIAASSSEQHQPAVNTSTTTAPAEKEAGGESSGEDDHERDHQAPSTTTTLLAAAVKPPQTKRRHLTLREQFAQVQNTPSRVVDVSNFEDTIQLQRGRILDRLKHAVRIGKCTALPDRFPIISDNIQSFERAMRALGPKYQERVAEFRTAFQQQHASAAA